MNAKPVPRIQYLRSAVTTSQTACVMLDGQVAQATNPVRRASQEHTRVQLATTHAKIVLLELIQIQ